MTSTGSGLVPAMRATSASACGRSRRLSVIGVMWERAGQGGTKFRPGGGDDEQRRGRRLLDQQPEQLQGRGIGPVQILPKRQQRLALGGFKQDGDQRVLRQLLLLLRCHLQSVDNDRPAIAVRGATRCKRHSLGEWLIVTFQGGFELRQFGFGCCLPAAIWPTA